MARLTLARLEQILRERLASGVELKLQPLFGPADGFTYPRIRPQPIILDPFRVGILDGLVHELMHGCFDDRLGKWGDLEETMTAAAERELSIYILTNPKRRERWRKLTEEVIDRTNGT